MPKLLIPDNFHDTRYHPGQDVPYDFTGAKLRDEIMRRCPDIEAIWARTPEETQRCLPDADIMMSKGMKAADFTRAVNLRWVHISSAGPDHFFKRSEVDAEGFRDRGVMITTSKGAGVATLSEQVLCYMLMFCRNMVLAVTQHLRGEWKRYAGLEFQGSTVGIIGLGTIGSRVAMLSKCHGTTIIGTKGNPAIYTGVADEVLPSNAYPEVLRRSDFVVLSCPINDDTRLMINDRTLAMMKPTAFLINVARGECVDEPALVRALKAGTIAGYAGDNHGTVQWPVTDENLERLAPDSELWGMPNVIVTPNCAVAGPRRYEHMAEIVAESHRCRKEGRQPPNRLFVGGRPV